MRQNFCAADLGESKAKVLATRYSEAFGIETLYHPAFLEKDEDLYRMVQPGDIWLDGKRVPELSILIGCVDNNKSRQKTVWRAAVALPRNFWPCLLYTSRCV